MTDELNSDIDLPLLRECRAELVITRREFAQAGRKVQAWCDNFLWRIENAPRSTWADPPRIVPAS